MYFRLTAVLLLLVGLACRGQAQEVDAKKLCDLIRTPSGSMMFGIGFNTKRGFVLAGESVDNSAEIAAIEKSLRGDATDAERYYQLSQLYEDTEKGKHAAAEAAKLFRKNLEQDPRDGRMALR